MLSISAHAPTRTSLLLYRALLTITGVSFLGYIAVYLLGGIESLFLLPFFVLSSNCSSSNDGTNCGNCGCDNAFSCFTSTPFLAVETKEGMCIENDVMFGKPLNSFPNRAVGAQMYKNETIVPDKYKLLNDPLIKDGKISLEIREIEPEESYIDYLRLERVTYSQNAELFVDASFEKMWVFEKEALASNEGVTNLTISSSKDSDIPDVLSRIGRKLSDGEYARTKMFIMEAGEYVEIEGRVQVSGKTPFLLVGSNFRDWLLDTPDPAPTSFYESPYQRSAYTFKRMLAFTFLLAPIWLLGSITSIFSSTNNTANPVDIDLAQMFGVPKANADIPHKSFLVEYWNGKSYQFYGYTHPRYYKTSFDVVALPREAVSEDHRVKVRLTATKRHNLTHLSLFAPEKHHDYRTDECKLESAVHSRTGEIEKSKLTQAYSDSYVHTVPADVVTLSFSSVAVNSGASDRSSYVLTIGGYYTSLSEEGRQLAGSQWQSKLSPESRVWLEEMQSYKTITAA